MHVKSYHMCRAVHSRSSDGLVLIFSEQLNGRHRIGARGPKTIYLLLVADTYHTCWLDGTKIVSGNEG